MVSAATDPIYLSSTGILDGSATECFTVTGVSSRRMAVNWGPNHSGTMTADSAFSGSLTFTLYEGTPGTGCTAGTAVQKYATGPVAVTVPASGQTFSTDNTSFFVNLADACTGDYFWLVHYDDASLTDPADVCEPSSVSIAAWG